MEEYKVAITQYAMLSWLSSELCIQQSTITVIGRRALGGLPPIAPCLQMPSITHFKMGSEDWSRGGGSPRESCMLCTADKI